MSTGDWSQIHTSDNTAPGMMIADSGLDTMEIDTAKIPSHGIERGQFLMADGSGGMEFGDMSTFDYNHNELVESLKGREKSELVEIIHRHRKTVEKIDDMMIELLADADICSRVVLENLNKTKDSAIQLIKYALCIMIDDTESIDKLEPEEKDEEGIGMDKAIAQLLGIQRSQNQPIQVMPSNPAIPSPNVITVPAQSTRHMQFDPKKLLGQLIGTTETGSTKTTFTSITS